MTQTSTFEDNRTRYTVSETFCSETKEEMHRKLKERLLLVMTKKLGESADTKKLGESADKLDNSRPI